MITESVPVIKTALHRLVTLEALLALGLGTVFMIPRESKTEPCRVRMELPELVGGWAGKPGAVSQKEHEVLAGDTQFCREVYENGLGDQILVSIVLSGHDLDMSIHRPERCLPAQGWTIQESKTFDLKVPSAPNGKLPVTRLYNSRQFRTDAGTASDIHNLNYYWFIGYSDLTASHFAREYIDVRDRLLHGYNQRWAYVTVAANLVPGRTVEETDGMIQGMIARIYPKIVTDQGAGTGQL